jgi:hypothetical protein
VAAEPDFVALSHCDWSLRKVIEKHPDGAPPKVVARALLLTEAEVSALLKTALKTLKEFV